MKVTEIKQLELKAARCRQKILRMCRAHNGGHLGGSFSCMDIVAALYFHTMKKDPKNCSMEDRDRFVLSAGHKSMAQYAALCECGYFGEDLLDRYGCLHCRMPGHPNMDMIPGIEANTGALGHGLAISCGMALGIRANKLPSRVFTISGDGELAEGSNWEAVAVAAHYHLDNLCLIIDNNGLQIGGNVKTIMSFAPIAAHFEGFGWSVREIDGHDMRQITDALDALPFEQGKPSVIIAKTVKGKGFSNAEGVGSYHFWTPAEGELEKAEAENHGND